ncbi:MAG: hypothetical protein IJI20_05355, partial [Firmicutes bacterium]|nr:hypothetical protein [Bacillota bacterium]
MIFAYFETRVNIGGKNYAVSFDVEVHPSNNKYRTHTVSKLTIEEMDAKKAESLRPARAIKPTGEAGTASSLDSNGTVPQEPKNVKTGQKGEKNQKSGETPQPTEKEINSMVKDATDRQKQIDNEISTIKSDETMTIQEKAKALDSIDSQKKAVDEEVESLKEAQDEIVPSKKDDAAKPEPRDVNNPDAKTKPEVSKALEGSKKHQEYVEKPRAEQIREQRPTFNELKKQ